MPINFNERHSGRKEDTQTRMKYKIIYHIGNEINLKTKVKGGTLTWQEHSVLVSNSASFEVPFASLLSIDMFRLQGLGRMIKLVCANRVIFLTVVWLDIAGYFAIVNFFKTGELFGQLKAQLRQREGTTT